MIYPFHLPRGARSKGTHCGLHFAIGRGVEMREVNRRTMPDRPKRTIAGSNLAVTEVHPAPALDAETQEHRANARFPFTATAEIIELRSKAKVAGRTSDLSLGGCYVDTINPFPVGTPVTLRLTYAGRTFQVQSAVVYAHVGMGMGIAFTQVTPDQLEVLQGWVGQLSGEVEPLVEQAAPASSEPLHRNERHVLNQLISLLIRKNLLTEAEGAALLRELFR
jgi:hypothetical protein